MTEIILLRHGETDANRELRFQGQVDVALNPTGHEQARRLAARLDGWSCDALVSSDLQRAMQTAQPIAHQLGQAPMPEPGFREQAFGTVDGWRAQDIQQQWPDHWARWLRFEADFAFPGRAESTRIFHARVMAALETWTNRHRGGRFLVVAHGGVLDMVYRSAVGQSLDGPRQVAIPNAGFNRVRVTRGAIEILEWADVSHLDGLGPQPVYVQRAGTSSVAER